MPGEETMPEVTFILPFDEICAAEASIQIKLKVKRTKNMTYKDSVGLFPFHWTDLKDSVCSVIVPRPRARDEADVEVSFNMPKTNEKFCFQFLYTTGDGRVAGMSERFKIVHKELADIRKLRNILGSFTAKQVQLETACVEKESQVERLQNLAGKLLKDLKDVKEKRRQEVIDFEQRNELLKNSLKEREELMKTMTEEIKKLEMVNFLILIFLIIF